MIIDMEMYLDNLPSSVEAIVGSRTVHAAFLRSYPHLTAEDVPLVTFNGESFEQLL